MLSLLLSSGFVPYLLQARVQTELPQRIFGCSTENGTACFAPCLALILYLFVCLVPYLPPLEGNRAHVFVE